MPRFMTRDGARMSIVIGLLVATLVVTAWMSMRAQYAARAHRMAAEKVVRDWTRVAADELVRRAENQASYYGIYRVLEAIRSAPVLPSAAELLSAAKTPLEQRNVRLVRETFRYEQGQPFANRELGAQLAKILADPPLPEEQEPLWIGEHVYVYSLPTKDQRISGFRVNRAALGPFFGLALTMRPLFPPSLADGRITNDAIAARVWNEDRGAESPSLQMVFATKSPIDPRLAVQHRAESGLLRGIVVETALTPEAAELIVAGSMTRQSPVYLVSLTVSVVLLIAAMLQIGRERALARMRSDFVAGVSHELRTPLTQIRMFVETLRLDRIRSDEERQRSLAIIDQEARRLTQLVENVLQFSRGERGVLRIAPTPADVGAIVMNAMAGFMSPANIETNIASPAFANVDEDAVRQIVLNLLDNAVKYGPDAQTIRVEVARAGDAIRIAVDDEGPGIPPRQRERIWRRYVRLERERTRAIAGAGIGLAVVRELAALHGGRAWCEDGSRGARFVVELPA
ncbi:MAG TPA: HAMP domain-containing sensor histidine kinase [Thermoanaerobaculia bacterium]|nr:HAMP domain-containing sensor histidine kinase [Thermoanaerobaculia bacterium]